MASIQQGSAGGVPVLILKEGTKENKGEEAQKNNITAAKLVAEIVKTSLGPRGMDKMLVDTLGDVTITNDGATVLKEIDVEHPAAKMMVEVAKSVDNEVGDGTTSSVVLAGSLIEKADQFKVDIDNIQIQKKPGGSIDDTSLIRGIVLDKEIVHSEMPRRIKDAKIALLNTALEIEKTEMSAKIRINDEK